MRKIIFIASLCLMGCTTIIQDRPLEVIKASKGSTKAYRYTLAPKHPTDLTDEYRLVIESDSVLHVGDAWSPFAR